jgi:hypothetical protein
VPISTARRPSRSWAFLELLDGECGILERHGRHPDEAPRVTPDDGRHVLVLHPREGVCGPRLRPVAEHHRRRREHLTVDPEPIHVLDPPLRAPRPVGDLAEDGIARHDRGAAWVAMDQPRPAAATVAAGEVLPLLGHDVRVEVDPHQRRGKVPFSSAVPPTGISPFVLAGPPRLTAGSIGQGRRRRQPPLPVRARGTLAAGPGLTPSRARPYVGRAVSKGAA